MLGGLHVHFVDALLQAGQRERATGVVLGFAELARRAEAPVAVFAVALVAAEAAAAAGAAAPAAAAEGALLAQLLQARADRGARRFVEVAAAQLCDQRLGLGGAGAVRGEAAHAHRPRREPRHRLAVAVDDAAVDAQAILQHEVHRLAKLRIDALLAQVEVAGGPHVDPHRHAGQVGQEEPALLVRRRRVVAVAAEAARATPAAPAAAARAGRRGRARGRGLAGCAIAAAVAAAHRQLAPQRHGRLRHRLAAGVAHVPAHLEAGAEADVVEIVDLLLFDRERRRASFGVRLGGRRQRPRAGGDVRSDVVAGRVGREGGRQLVALAQGAQRVVVLRLQLQARAADAIAFEVGDAAADLAAVRQRQLAEVQLGGDVADVLVELRRRVAGMGDLQPDAQVAEGLALEGKAPVGVGRHRLGHAPLAIAGAAAAAAEVEPDGCLRHGRAKRIDDAAAQQHLDALVGPGRRRRQDRLGALQCQRAGLATCRLRLGRSARHLLFGGRVPPHRRRLAVRQQRQGQGATGG